MFIFGNVIKCFEIKSDGLKFLNEYICFVMNWQGKLRRSITFYYFLTLTCYSLITIFKPFFRKSLSKVRNNFYMKCFTLSMNYCIYVLLNISPISICWWLCSLIKRNKSIINCCHTSNIYVSFWKLLGYSHILSF